MEGDRLKAFRNAVRGAAAPVPGRLRRKSGREDTNGAHEDPAAGRRERTGDGL